ncbi:MAG: hypothetical protein QOE54_6646 [Streptosporangiaceae bacterium]|jgi:hypothetical protein|nr:hypothetical protein [Streptosporangiaceae bacterium]
MSVDLRKLAAELRGRLPVTTEAAARVCAALKAGARPETGDVDLILRALTDFDGARVRLVEVRSEGPMPETFEMLSQALDAAAAEASRSERLRRLVGIRGPAALENILEQVRQAARTGESSQLHLLAQLMDLAADTSDFQELDDAAELARERLPDRWRPLINAALNRRLATEELDRPRAKTGNDGAATIPAPQEDGPVQAASAPRQEPGSADVRPTLPQEQPDEVAPSARQAAPGEVGPQTDPASPEDRAGEAASVPQQRASVSRQGADGARLAAASGERESDGAAPSVSLEKAGQSGAEVASVSREDGSVPPVPSIPRQEPGGVGAQVAAASIGEGPGEGQPTKAVDESNTPVPLGAPPAFGSGHVEASEIVLEFAEPIEPSAPHGGLDQTESPADTKPGIAGETPAGTPASDTPANVETRSEKLSGVGLGTRQAGAVAVGNSEAGTLGAANREAGAVAVGRSEVARNRGPGAMGADRGGLGNGKPGAAEAEMAALQSARFGLAAWLRTAAGRPAVEAQARRCAGLARGMGDFAGRLSAEFSATAEGLDARSLADDPAGGILAWAAALRAGIVHPTPESIRLLDDLAPVVSRYPGLSAYGEAFADAADSGAYLIPGSAGDGQGAQAGQNRQRAVRASVRLLEEGPHRRLEPALVEETWRALVQQDAPLGRLLEAAARDDAAQVDEVADRVAELRVGETLGQLIDETVQRVAGGPAESTTTIWLGGMIGDALEMVARWVSAVKGTGSVGADRLAEALAELRASIERNEELAAAELSGPVAAGGPVLAAAAGAARLLIRETLELLDGAPVRTAEPPYAHVVNRELLLAPAVKVHPATLAPYQPPALADLIPVALAPDEEWEAAFEARAAQGDHEGTRGIIAVLERQEPGRVLPLRLRREELVRAARSARDERVRNLRVRMTHGMRDGALDGAAAARIEETLQDLTGPLRDDFGRVRTVLDELETDIARGTSHNLKLLGGAAGSSAPHP